MGTNLSDNLHLTPTTPAQDADAATYVRRVAAAQGWAAGDVLAALGLL